MECRCGCCDNCVDFAEEQARIQRIDELDISNIAGLTGEKGSDDFFLDAVRSFWNETGLDTGSWELRVIVAWFDRRRRELCDD